MIKHEEYKEMLAAHALGALEAEDVRTLEAHLAECAECRAEMDDWLDTASALAYSVPAAAPSNKLRSRILKRVRSEAAFSSHGKSRALADSITRASSSPDDVPIKQGFAPRASKMWLRPLAIAATLACLTLLSSLIFVWMRNNAMRAEVERLSKRLNETQAELARAREDTEFLNAPTLTIASLQGTEMAKNARARLAMDHKTGRALLFTYDLPPAPAGKAYQLWFIAGGRAIPGGVFTTDAQGQAKMREQIPAEARDAKLFAITLEPAGGVQSPTGEKYLLGS